MGLQTPTNQNEKPQYIELLIMKHITTVQIL
jgi:hypothetical protein